MYAFRKLSPSLLLVLAVGCGSSESSTEKDDTGTDTSNSAGGSNTTNTTGSSNASGTTVSGNSSGSPSTTGSSNTATAAGGDGGSGGSGGATSGSSTTDASAGGSGGGGGNAGGSGSGGAGTGTSAGTSTGGTVADPGCGSHKWACWPMPNMVGSGLPNEASYTVNDDGSVLDNVTQLMWDGQIYAQTFTWEDALGFCEELELSGFDDWRLPTRIEVTSVLDHSDEHTGWAAEALPNANGGFHFTASDWILTITQTGAGAGNDYTWAFNMSDGIVSNAYSKSNVTPARCVRGGGSGEGPSEPAVAPPDQYSIVAEGEVRDNYTGLVWQRGGSEDMLSWQEAVDYCEGLELNGNSWRLPSIRELATLVDEAQVAPAINREMFPDTKYGARSNDWYWATPERGSAAWGLNFDDGFTGTNTGSAAWNTFGPSWARCVR